MVSRAGKNGILLNASLFVVSLEKACGRIPHVGVVDRWSATPKRAGYSALIAFS